MDRLEDTTRFYQLLDRLEASVGGTRRLVECTGRMDWPRRGLYFFFEPGELRSGSGEGRRVVRVGTHALTDGTRSTLWGRVSQHRGTQRGDGNHRGSIFRLLVGVALTRQGVTSLPASWGVGSDAGTAARRLGLARTDLRVAEADLELHVSRYVGEMPFLWLEVGDEPALSTSWGRGGSRQGSSSRIWRRVGFGPGQARPPAQIATSLWPTEERRAHRPRVWRCY